MCCNCECAEHKKEATLVFTPDKERGCTDLFFLLLFVGMWAAVIAVFSSAATKGGDPDKLLRGVDYLGRVCGKDEGVKDQQYAAWPSVLDYNVKLCVENCDATQTDTRFFINYETNLYFYYCLPFPDVDVLLNYTSDDGFWNDESSFSTGDGDSEVDSPSQTAARAMGDLYTTYPVILISGFVALILSYFYAELVKYIGGCIVWTSLLLIVAGGFLLGYAFLYAADVTQKEQPDEASTTVQVERALGWFSIAATVVFLLMICFLRKRISMAIEVVKEASRAINDMRMLVCVPVFPFLFAMLYTFFWCVVALYIFSVTVEKEYPIPNSLNADYSYWIEPPYPDTYTQLEWDREMQNSFALIFFHLLWQVEFLIYFCYLVVAGAIAQWYFSLRNEQGEKIRGEAVGQLPEDAITQSVKRACRFHLGSICFGALIIAIIKFCRAVVTYIQMKTKHRQNFLMKCGFYCVQCCLKCIDCCCDKISKNAYVWIAIYGHSYLTSACSAFMLVWSNLARLAAIELVGELILNLGKVMIALMTTGVCGVFIFAYYRDSVSNISMPCFVIFMLSYLVATLFMVVFDTTIDTVFLCFLVDEKHNKGTGQMLASKELRELVDKYEEESKKDAALRKGETDTTGVAGEPPGGPINKA